MHFMNAMPVIFCPNMTLHRRADSQSSDNQSDQTYHSEESGRAVKRARQCGIGLRVVGDPGRASKRGFHLRSYGCEVSLLWELQENTLRDAADIADDARVLQALTGKKNARAKSKARCHAIRFADYAGGDSKLFCPDANPILRGDLQTEEKIVGNSYGVRVQLCVWRIQFDSAIKGILREVGAFDGSQNRSAIQCRSHADRFGNTRRLDAFGFELMNGFEIGVGRMAGKPYGDIGGHQTSSFAAKRVANRFVETCDGSQCTRSQSDCQHEKRELSGGGAGFPPGHAQSKLQPLFHFAIRPSVRRMCR
jgi:hypothetical protein